MNNYSRKRTIALILLCLLALASLLITSHRYNEKRALEQQHAQLSPPSHGPESSPASPMVMKAAPVIPAAAPFTKITIKKGDSLAKIFSRKKWPIATLIKILEDPTSYQYLKTIQAKQILWYQVNSQKQLMALKYPLSKGKLLLVQRTPSGFKAQVKQLLQQTREVSYKLSIDSGSVARSLQRAGISANIRAQFANTFAWKFNFNKHLRHGDQVELLIQEDKYSNNSIQQSRLLAASLIQKGKTLTAIRFKQPNGKVGYYTPKGQNLVGRFLKKPLHYSYISSYFSLHRLHPILHIVRPHYGVDFAAPIGTPVHAAADGVIQFLGKKGGYGNVVEIKHGHHYATVYAHLSKFKPGLHRYNSVLRGQVIGYVGQSGLATGPNLHYEIHFNGQRRNPLTIPLPNGLAVPKAYQGLFAKLAKQRLQTMQAQRQTHWASHQDETTSQG